MTPNRSTLSSSLSATETKHMSHHHLRSLLIASLTLLALLLAASSGTARADEASVFEVRDFTAQALDAANHDYTVAGGNPYEASTSFAIPKTSADGVSFTPVEPVKSTFTELPPGFLGNLAGVPRCPLSLLAADPYSVLCPAETRVGTLLLYTNGNPTSTAGLYNMVPERGYPAALAFHVLNNSIVLYPRLRSRTGGYGVTVSVPGAADIGITGAEATVFGVPSQRPGPFSPPAGGPPVPILSNLSNCLVAKPVTRMIIDSWRQPGRLTPDGFPDLSDGRWKTAVAPAPPVTGCDASGLVSQFAPSIDARPTPEVGSTQAGAPSGYTVALDFPQSNDATDLSTTFDPSVPAAPPLKDATVTLPEGVVVSPGAADGLDGCTDQGPGDQVYYDTTNPVTCPDASKIGTVTATSPLLAQHDPDTDQVTGAEPVGGEVFIVKSHPGDFSPSGDGDGKFRLLIQVNSAKYGVNVKLPGIATADKATGRLTARFEDNPQLPVKHLQVTFKPGDRAALVNPSTCGAAKTTTVFTPWSRGGTRSDGVQVSGTPDATPSSSFDVSWDGNGATCPATLPFSPTLTAGTVDPAAGKSSAFTLTVDKEDRQQNIAGLDVSLPAGLLANIKNLPFCAESKAASGNCDAASQLGVTTVAAGAGPAPLYVPQPGKSPTAVYFAGPYKGAPFSLVVRVPAQAGPFDLGVVSVRAALFVDRHDAHVTVKPDPLPQVLDGVPVQYRKINVLVHRPGFMRNPTHCEPSTITANLTSSQGAKADLSVPFNAAGCSKLAFKPKLSLTLTGKGQSTDGKHPALSANLTQPFGQANNRKATVSLPLSLALDPDNAASDSLCSFIEGSKEEPNCPASSIVGRATAITPILNGPVSGPVYFVKNVRKDPKSGREIRTLPKLVLPLVADNGVKLTLVGTSDVVDNQLVTTFDNLPDAPVSSFRLDMIGGKKGILVVSGDKADICASAQVAELQITGQNHKHANADVAMQTPSCPLKILSKKVGKTTVAVKVGGLGAGKLTVTGHGIKKTTKTIASATVATITPKRTKGKPGKVTVSFDPAGPAKARKTSK